MSAQLKDKDLHAFLHGFSSLSQIREHGPQVMVRGEGVYVFDADGRRYLEANSGLWNAVLGFSDEVVLAAARNQFEEISAYHTFFGRNSVAGIELAALLVALMIAITGYLWVGEGLSFEVVARQESNLRDSQQAHPLFTYGVAFLVYVTVTGVSLPGASVLTLIFGWLFGFWAALLLVSLSLIHI